MRAFLTLAYTCRHLKEVAFRQGGRLLETALDTHYGPVRLLLQLALYDDEGSASNQPGAIQAHQVPALLALGRVAEEWCQIYPLKKWNEEDNIVDRRSLDGAEARCLRTAVYRVWLYGARFHDAESAGLDFDEDANEDQVKYLRRYETCDLADMLDFHQILLHVLSSSICPSNETVVRRVRKRVGDSRHLDFSVPSARSSRPHLAVNSPQQVEGVEIAWPARRSFDRYKPTREHDPAQEGWGSGNAHYTKTRRMTKLNPAQILYLRKHARTKTEVMAAVDYWADLMRSGTSKLLDFRRDFANGVPRAGSEFWNEEWLLRNEETLDAALEYVFTERGYNFRRTKAEVKEGRMGILDQTEGNGDEASEE
ncbi:MAG: hypothetical protein Q9157_003519 [Trypethelium eluteriae]